MNTMLVELLIGMTRLTVTKVVFEFCNGSFIYKFLHRLTVTKVVFELHWTSCSLPILNRLTVTKVVFE